MPAEPRQSTLGLCQAGGLASCVLSRPYILWLVPVTKMLQGWWSHRMTAFYAAVFPRVKHRTALSATREEKGQAKRR